MTDVKNFEIRDGVNNAYMYIYVGLLAEELETSSLQLSQSASLMGVCSESGLINTSGSLHTRILHKSRDGIPHSSFRFPLSSFFVM